MSLQKIGKYIEEFTKKNKNDAPYPVYSVTNSNGFCTDYFSKDVSGQDKTTYKIVPKGYFAYNPSRINVGSIDWQNSEDNVIVSPLYVVFKCSDSLDQDYLKYFLKSSVGVRLINEKTSGSVRNSLKFKELSEFELNIVDVEEQRKIVNTLKLIESAIENEKKQINLYDELVKARFVEMFGDPVLNEKGWNTKPLLEMGSCKNGMNFHYEDSGIDINCLGVGDFKEYSVIENTALLPIVSLNKMPEPEYLLQDDDIVFVRSNGNKALVGRSVAVYPGTTPTTFSGFCIRYRKHDDAITIPYLLRVLKTDSIRMKMAGRGANIQNLNQQILGALIIPVPPIDLQKQFSEFIKHIDKSKFVAKKRLKLYEELLEKKTYDFYIR
ncbi:restriction endonuclease subunit S [Succinimonas amylolytica]|uniref:restriction endonuclease subunit S n=1 Tax=Succinimonas amylolytica TaxID=83769 RepID=UPI000370B3BD|nr:restriction endonuclease subunit S [Succinimonas amylolytica]